MTALIVIASIVAAIFLLAAFIKKEYRIERNVLVERPVADVYNYVKYLRNQENFSKWVMQDPTMQKEFRGVDGTVGAVYGWNGNNKVGEGEQEIVGLEENKKVNIQIRFVRPFKNVAHTPFDLYSDSPGKTRIKWTMIGANKFPMTLMNLFIDSLLGKDMQESLNNLKKNLEKTIPQTV